MTTEILIEPGYLRKHYWKDIWRYRELLHFLAWRDILVRYKGAIFGIAWALARPLLVMVIFTFIFSNVAGLSSVGAPYYLLVFVGTLPWQLVSGSITDSTGSLIADANLVRKSYFPRILIPCSSILVNILDFSLALLVLIPLIGFSLEFEMLHLITLPLFLILAITLCLAASLWLSILNVKYRDFRYVVPVILQFGLYISPVGYSTSSVPPSALPLFAINPMVGIIEGFRYALLGIESEFLWQYSLISAFVTVLILISGLLYFAIAERSLADII